jgi:hypothetical protein
MNSHRVLRPRRIVYLDGVEDVSVSDPAGDEIKRQVEVLNPL